MKKSLLWIFPIDRMISSEAVFSSEWTISRDEMFLPEIELSESTIWLVAESKGRMFLFGHIHVVKITRLIDETRNNPTVLISDPLLSFSISKKYTPRWEIKILNFQYGIIEASLTTIEEISNMMSYNAKISIAKPNISFTIPNDILLGNSPTLIAEKIYAYVLRYTELDGKTRLSSNRTITPFGCIALQLIPDGFKSGAKIKKLIEKIDSRVNQALYADTHSSASVQHLQKSHNIENQQSPIVDTTLLPLDPNRITARIFLKSKSDFNRDTLKKISAADARHQEILQRCSAEVLSFGLNPLWSESIDLAFYAKEKLYLFEIKSSTKSNFNNQIRKGLFQIFEYRIAFEQRGYSNIQAALLIDKSGSEEEELYFEHISKKIEVAVFYYTDETQFNDVLSWVSSKNS